MSLGRRHQHTMERRSPGQQDGRLSALGGNSASRFPGHWTRPLEANGTPDRRCSGERNPYPTPMCTSQQGRDAVDVMEIRGLAAARRSTTKNLRRAREYKDTAQGCDTENERANRETMTHFLPKSAFCNSMSSARIVRFSKRPSVNVTGRPIFSRAKSRERIWRGVTE